MNDGGIFVHFQLICFVFVLFPFLQDMRTRGQARAASDGGSPVQQKNQNPKPTNKKTKSTTSQKKLPLSFSRTGYEVARDFLSKPKRTFLQNSPEYILRPLYPHQVDAVNFLLNVTDFAAGALFADQMGLGKTSSVLAFLSYLKFER